VAAVPKILNQRDKNRDCIGVNSALGGKQLAEMRQGHPTHRFLWASGEAPGSLFRYISERKGLAWPFEPSQHCFNCRFCSISIADNSHQISNVYQRSE